MLSSQGRRQVHQQMLIHDAPDVEIIKDFLKQLL